MKICICIPCVDLHIPLLEKFLVTIVRFTRQPDEVIVSLSPKFETTCLQERADTLCNNFSNLNLKILVQPSITTAAINLNKIHEISTSDILVRCDADDIIHPQKLEIVESIFKKYPDTKLILHRWIMSNKIDYSLIHFNHIEQLDDNDVHLDIKPYNKIDLQSISLSEKYKGGIELLSKSNWITNGANVYTKEVANRIKYINRNFAEDKLFNSEVTKYFKKTIFLDCKLIIISPIGSGSWR